MSAKKVDMTGQRFGKLVVLDLMSERYRGTLVWKCQCDCGTMTFVPGSRLRLKTRSGTKSCGCLKGIANAKNLVGKRFGKLTVLSKTNSRWRGQVIWHCRCDCGNIINCASHKLIRKTIINCGCMGMKWRPNLIGQKFGWLLVKRFVGIQGDVKKGTNQLWECECRCGNKTIITTNELHSKTKSCGCLYYASMFSRGTNIDPMGVPLEIVSCLQARGELKKAIKQAS